MITYLQSKTKKRPTMKKRNYRKNLFISEKFSERANFISLLYSRGNPSK